MAYEIVFLSLTAPIMLNSFITRAIFDASNCSISRGENEGRVVVASTASEYPLADFVFRGTPAPKHENCLLG